MRPQALLLLAICAGCASDDTTTDPIVGADGGVVEEQPDARPAGDTPDAAVENTPDAPPTKTCDGVTVELGTGNREFIATDDGALIYLFKGPQGGYMVYLSVRAKGINPDDATLCYTEHVVDTNKDVGQGCWNIKLPNDLGDGIHERVGVWGQLDSKYWTYPSAVRGHTLRVDATLSDKSGCGASDGWTVMVSPDAPM